MQTLKILLLVSLLVSQGSTARYLNNLASSQTYLQFQPTVKLILLKATNNQAS